MLRSKFKFLIRNLFRNKIYAFFSVISLCIAFVCCIMIYLYVSNELSYDRFFENSDKIARLEYVSTLQSGESNRYAILPSYFIPTQFNSIPEINTETRIAPLPNIFFQFNGQNKIAENSGFVADSNFFDVFTFNFLKANLNNPLSKPNSMVITQAMADKYFGKESPLGKTLIVSYGEHEKQITITAVINKVPSNSHIEFNFLIDAKTFKDLFGKEISKTYVAYEYLLLFENEDLKRAEEKLSDFKPKLENAENFSFSYALQPITDIHLYSSSQSQIKPVSNIRYVIFYILISVIILFISTTNFVSLFLSQSTTRYREIGVRKALGGHNYQILSQFLFESVFISIIALLIALLLSYFSLPIFNNLTGCILSYFELLSLPIIFKFLTFAVFIGIVAGLYPAAVLSQKNNISLLRSTTNENEKDSLFQKTIVIIQFTASAVLIIGTIIIYNQLDFVFSKELGFSKERIITTDNYLENQLDVFKESLSNDSGIESVSASSYIPGTSGNGGTGPVESLENGNKASLHWVSVDYDYFDTFDIDIHEGRTFSKDLPTDSSSAFIINKVAAEVLGLDDPLGKNLSALNRRGKIIGVVENFNYLSLHQPIPPMLFLIEDDYYFSLAIKIAPNRSLPDILDKIERAWYSFQPNTPFRYSFLENQYDKLYQSEINRGKSFFVFSFIAILVSCLGLFSLASYSMTKRTKEIGIRKVLGATVLDILGMLYKKYFKLIILANLIAIPVAYYLLSNWLTNFAFKTEIGLFPFLITFALISILTVIVISYWALKAAFQNPIYSIQTE